MQSSKPFLKGKVGSAAAWIFFKTLQQNTVPSLQNWTQLAQTTPLIYKIHIPSLHVSLAAVLHKKGSKGSVSPWAGQCHIKVVASFQGHAPVNHLDNQFVITHVSS